MNKFEILFSHSDSTQKETPTIHSSDLESRVAALESQIATFEFRENNTANYAMELERKIKRLFKILKRNKVKLKVE